MPVSPRPHSRARSPHEQLSPTEDGLTIFDALGLCRFEIRSGGQSLGALILTSTSPSTPYAAERDYWCWSGTAWPQAFTLRHAPTLSLPTALPGSHPQVTFTAPSAQHDLSAPGDAVWRVRLVELVQGVPATTDLGFFVRHANGTLAWFADAAPAGSVFEVPADAWLDLTRVPNAGLVVEAILAIPGAIS